MSVGSAQVSNQLGSMPVNPIERKSASAPPYSSTSAKPKWRPPAWSIIAIADALGLAVPIFTRTSGRGSFAAMGLMSLLLYQSRGLYRSRLHLSVLDDLPALISATTIAAL